MEELKNMITELIQEIREIKQGQSEYLKEILEIKKENIQLKRDVKILEHKLEKMEKEKRKNNVIITGMEFQSDNQQEMKQVLENLVKEQLHINTEIKKVEKISDKRCIVEMETFEGKLKILKHKRKLRKTGRKEIFINSDLTPKERDIDYKIRKRAKEEINNGKNVIIKYQKLIINGIEWKWNEEREELERMGKCKTTEPKN